MNSSEVTDSGCLTGLIRGALRLPTGWAERIHASMTDYCLAAQNLSEHGFERHFGNRFGADGYNHRTFSSLRSG